MTGRSFLKALCLCVAIAGTLDISDALIFYGLRGVAPERLLQAIASGLLGPAAMHGGLRTAALGLAIHYTITLCWSALFLGAATKLTFLTRYAVCSGALYGVLIYLAMNFVILPFTPVVGHPHHPTVIVVVNGVLALMLCMGLPIALITRRLLHN